MVFLVDCIVNIAYNHSMIRKQNKEQNMSYVVYRTDTSAIVEETRYKQYHKSEASAKGSMTRINKVRIVDALKDKKDYKFGAQPKYWYLGNAELAVADTKTYLLEIEQEVTKTNMMTGKEYKESINTPLSCSPASETYWSM